MILFVTASAIRSKISEKMLKKTAIPLSWRRSWRKKERAAATAQRRILRAGDAWSMSARWWMVVTLKDRGVEF